LQLEGGQKIRLDHMPDVLHPNAAGMEQLLTTCLDPALGLKAARVVRINGQKTEMVKNCHVRQALY